MYYIKINDIVKIQDILNIELHPKQIRYLFDVDVEFKRSEGKTLAAIIKLCLSFNPYEAYTFKDIMEYGRKYDNHDSFIRQRYFLDEFLKVWFKLSAEEELIICYIMADEINKLIDYPISKEV